MNNCEFIRFEKGEYQCIECGRKVFCSDCCTKLHKHLSHSNHDPIALHLNSDHIKSGQKSSEYSDHHGASLQNHLGDGDGQFSDNDSLSEFDISA